ncbi:MAG: PHP domain-containing protein [Dehalococcoidales bacterium]|nr:PHP domain-containing protein [Dehalococcoidales bacterium]
MPKIDLHIHTNASDGKYSPAEIVRKAAGLGLEAIAISDHDTVNGIKPALEAAQEFPKLNLIPAVELSTDVPSGEIHVLGYYIDYTNEEFEANLSNMRSSRLDRAHKIIAKLAELGMKIDYDRVQQIAGTGTLGRPHIAQALMEKGYIQDFKEAFSKYIGHGGPAYVERDKLTPVEAVQLIGHTGGLPVLAHPLTAGNVENIILELKPAGLVGMEVYYAAYAFEEVSPLLGLAYKHGLIATGGTDYHGIDSNSEMMMGGVDVPPRAVEQLTRLAQERGLKIPGKIRKE